MVTAGAYAPGNSNVLLLVAAVLKQSSMCVCSPAFFPLGTQQEPCSSNSSPTRAAITHGMFRPQSPVVVSILNGFHQNSASIREANTHRKLKDRSLSFLCPLVHCPAQRGIQMTTLCQFLGGHVTSHKRW